MGHNWGYEVLHRNIYINSSKNLLKKNQNDQKISLVWKHLYVDKQKVCSHYNPIRRYRENLWSSLGKVFSQKRLKLVWKHKLCRFKLDPTMIPWRKGGPQWGIFKSQWLLMQRNTREKSSHKYQNNKWSFVFTK